MPQQRHLDLALVLLDAPPLLLQLHADGGQLAGILQRPHILVAHIKLPGGGTRWHAAGRRLAHGRALRIVAAGGTGIVVRIRHHAGAGAAAVVVVVFVDGMLLVPGTRQRAARIRKIVGGHSGHIVDAVGEGREYY